MPTSGTGPPYSGFPAVQQIGDNVSVACKQVGEKGFFACGPVTTGAALSFKCCDANKSACRRGKAWPPRDKKRGDA
jgi:hypothetical protein